MSEKFFQTAANLSALLAHYTKTGWHEAVKRGDTESVVAQLDAGAEINATGDNADGWGSVGRRSFCSP